MRPQLRIRCSQSHRLETEKAARRVLSPPVRAPLARARQLPVEPEQRDLVRPRQRVVGIVGDQRLDDGQRLGPAPFARGEPRQLQARRRAGQREALRRLQVLAGFTAVADGGSREPQVVPRLHVRRVSTIRALQPLDGLVDIVARWIGRRLRLEPMQRGRQASRRLVQRHAVRRNAPGRRGRSRRASRRRPLSSAFVPELDEVTVAAPIRRWRAIGLLRTRSDVLWRQRVVVTLLVMQKNGAVRVA